ncbi:hypothetical protein OQA88_1598 [Cercophora sp. LCS_1]
MSAQDGSSHEHQKTSPSTIRKLDELVGKTAVEFAQQAAKLSHHDPSNGNVDDVAVKAEFVTPYDAAVVTSEGNRLPAVPLAEAHKLNVLKEELEDNESALRHVKKHHVDEKSLAGVHRPDHEKAFSRVAEQGGHLQKPGEGSLNKSMPPSHTNPLFPPLPLYGPRSRLRSIQCMAFRVSSFFLSLAFLAVIVLGSLFTSIGPFLYRLWLRATLRDPDKKRPFYEEEQQRRVLRHEQEREWQLRSTHSQNPPDTEGTSANRDDYIPTEGGRDPIVCDVGYYARRVGLDIEEFEVQTEDGFIIDLWHVYDPREYRPLLAEERAHRGPEVFEAIPKKQIQTDDKPRFPVLLMHGLLQSSGAYCVNDEDSLAFFLCKSGFDVWIGNNRCGFKPKHVLLGYSDPRMWCWNIRQMGVFDLPALTSRVLYETGFEKIGLIAHSQGTTETFVALAKEQRPDLGEKLTVFCALAPAAYAGPLVGKMYFKFMRVITPAMFRLMFGIHAFIPFMMTMHQVLNPRIYGWMGYKVFSFLFNWTDERWDRGLRDRMFQFAPVYVSAESMRWWLGRECFAKHKCILATKEEWKAEEREDRRQEDQVLKDVERDLEGREESGPSTRKTEEGKKKPRGKTAWYNELAPPMAFWVCGNDALVDGAKLLRRFERGREPHVRLVHTKVIEEYEHLDVIWAMDAVDKVFKEVREVLWKTCNVRDMCRVPKGCEDVEAWKPEVKEEAEDEREFESDSL